MPQAAPGLLYEDGSKLANAAWEFLHDEMEELKQPLAGKVLALDEFLSQGQAAELSPEDRRLIVDQAQLLFEHLYPHLPSKIALFGKNPLDFLEQARKGIGTDSEAAFHSLMIAAFSSVRDAHTVYGCGQPLRGAIAFLPFQMCVVQDASPNFPRRYFVTRVMKRSRNSLYGDELFGPGAEIVGWENQPIDTQVNQLAAWLPGGNAAARFARATLACTLRSLTSNFTPTEFNGARIQYIPEGREEIRGIRFPWGGVASFTDVPVIPGETFSISPVHEDYMKGMTMQCRESLRDERAALQSTDDRAVSHLPEVFEFQFTGGPQPSYPIDIGILTAAPGQESKRYAYLRIKSFRDNGNSVGMAERIVDEARRILAILDREAPDGLILDVRGNPGGEIKAAERILQLFTAREISPELFHYADSDPIRRLLARVRSGEASADARLEFESWVHDPDTEPPPPPEARLTAGRPLTAPATVNDIGQIYHGPVTLLTDAHTYSAADIFAAGFQDHNIGFVLSYHSFTGGGGANVWNHSDIVRKLGPDLDIGLALLPAGITMRIAFRRSSRVGFFKGKPLEDLGVQVNQTYLLKNVDDVADQFPGLIKEAVRLFSVGAFRRPQLAVEKVERRGGFYFVALRHSGLAFVRLRLDTLRAVVRKAARKEVQTFRIPAPPKGQQEPFTLRVEGFVPFQPKELGHARVCLSDFPLRPPEPAPSADDVAAQIASFNQFFKPL